MSNRNSISSSISLKLVLAQSHRVIL